MVFVMLCTLSGFEPDPRAPTWVKVLGTLGPVMVIVYFAIGAVGTCIEILHILAEAQTAAG